MSDPYERECDEPGFDPGPDEDDDDFDGCPGCADGDCDDGDSDFADPGSGSALRAATESNPRDLPCRRCGTENVLTHEDRARGYVCDACADRAERGCD